MCIDRRTAVRRAASSAFCSPVISICGPTVVPKPPRMSGGCDATMVETTGYRRRLPIHSTQLVKDGPDLRHALAPEVESARLNAPAPAVDHLLCPLAFAFMDAYPVVKIEIISDAAVIDIVEQGFDAGVRFGKQLAQDMIALPFAPPLRYAIVASPDYIEKHGQPQTPHDLVGHDCIKRRFPGGTLVTWRLTDGNEEMEISPTGRLTVSAAQNELQAALAGRGIAHIIDDYAKPIP